MLLGVDYYPEQWPLELLEEDLDQIRQLGCNVIRIGEFAWKLMEPQEGVYDFSFFDHVISRAKERGLKIIFGTPTATPPAWLAAVGRRCCPILRTALPGPRPGAMYAATAARFTGNIAAGSSPNWRSTIGKNRLSSPGSWIMS